MFKGCYKKDDFSKMLAGFMNKVDWEIVVPRRAKKKFFFFFTLPNLMQISLRNICILYIHIRQSLHLP